MPLKMTIAKKEFKDHISDRSFLLYFDILLVAVVERAFYFIQWVQDWTISFDSPSEKIEEGVNRRFNSTYIVFIKRDIT